METQKDSKNALSWAILRLPFELSTTEPQKLEEGIVRWEYLWISAWKKFDVKSRSPRPEVLSKVGS